MVTRANKKKVRTIPPCRVGDIVLDSPHRRVQVNDGPWMSLTFLETRLLYLLMKRAGKIVPHALIDEKVWESPHWPMKATRRVHICWLRHKIGRRRIETVRRQGYRLVP